MTAVLIGSQEVKCVWRETAVDSTFSHTVNVCFWTQNGSINRTASHGEAAALTSQGVCKCVFVCVCGWMESHNNSDGCFYWRRNVQWRMESGGASELTALPVLHLAAVPVLKHPQQPLAWTSSKCCQGQGSTAIQHHAGEGEEGMVYWHLCKSRHRPWHVCSCCGNCIRRMERVADFVQYFVYVCCMCVRW